MEQKDLEGLSVEEFAAEMTVRMNKYRSRKTMSREELQKVWQHGEPDGISSGAPRSHLVSGIDISDP